MVAEVGEESNIPGENVYPCVTLCLEMALGGWCTCVIMGKHDIPLSLAWNGMTQTQQHMILYGLDSLDHLVEKEKYLDDVGKAAQRQHSFH